MKITFPAMGNIWIPLKSLFEDLGHEVILPPPCTKRTLSLGTKYGPESACLPLKINIGNYIEALEKGAETIVMAGGVGPCRFGFYAQVAKEILTDLGYDFEMIVLDPAVDKRPELVEQLRRLGSGNKAGVVLGALRLAWEKFRAVDLLEKTILEHRGRVSDPKKASAVYRRALAQVDRSASVKDAKVAVSNGIQEIKALPGAPGRPAAHVGIVGEIYTVLEPSASLNLEECLGYMGARVTRTMFIGEWVWHHVILSALNGRRRRRLRRLAHPYLNHFVGGHGLESVAHTVELAREGIDGVIHILPFTCMPEIVAQSILPRVSRDYEIPVMTVVVDEHTGEAGMITRLEAFLELIVRKRASGVSEVGRERIPRYRRGVGVDQPCHN